MQVVLESRVYQIAVPKINALNLSEHNRMKAYIRTKRSEWRKYYESYRNNMPPQGINENPIK